MTDVPQNESRSDSLNTNLRAAGSSTVPEENLLPTSLNLEPITKCTSNCDPPKRAPEKEIPAPRERPVAA